MCQCHGSTKACIRPPPVSSVPLLEQLLCPMSSEHGSSAQPSVRVSTRIATGPPHSIPIVCKFHVGGFCANGDSCRFLHPSLDGRDADSQSTTQTASISSVSSLSFAPPSVTNFVKTVSQRDVGQASPSRHSSTTQNQNQQDDGGHGYVDFADAYASIFQDGGHVDGEDCSEQFSTLSVNSSGNHDFVTNLDAVHARSSYAGAAGSNLPRDATSISPTRYRWEHVNENFASDFVTFESILCKYHMDGTCKYGQNCMYLHGTFCSTCRKNSLHPTDNAKAAKHVAECAADETMRARIQASTTVDCGICYENPTTHSRKFGLLQNCEHAFCLPCIREWRGVESAGSFGREAVRTCPVCRVESHLIIPSEHFEADAAAKHALLENYRAKLRTIPCKHFAFGDGACPFGTSCMYSHVDKDGNEPDRDCCLLFSDTGSRIKAAPTLSDYF